MPKSTTTTATYKTVRQPKTHERVSFCLVPHCEREAAIKGLCGRCYAAAKKLINSGEATREQLENMGLLKQKTANPFINAFRAMQANQKKVR